MSSVFEGTSALQWLFATLSANPALSGLVRGVYRDHAPQGCPMPYLVIWQHGPGSDDNTGGARALSHVDRGVKVVSIDGDQDDDSSAALNLIDGLLDSVSVPISGGSILLTIKAGGEIDYPESAAGARYYRHRGRLWRMTTTATTAQ